MSNSKPSWHGDLPWGRLRRAYRFLRRLFFSAPEPTDRPSIITEASLDELRDVLGQRSFAPNWEYSFHKRGEDLNLARIELWSDHDHVDGNSDPIIWWQTHIRGWKREGGHVELRAHWEPEPTEYPQAHLDGAGHDIQRAMDDLRVILDEEGIEYRDGA